MSDSKVDIIKKLVQEGVIKPVEMSKTAKSRFGVDFKPSYASLIMSRYKLKAGVSKEESQEKPKPATSDKATKPAKKNLPKATKEKKPVVSLDDSRLFAASSYYKSCNRDIRLAKATLDRFVELL